MTTSDPSYSRDLKQLQNAIGLAIGEFEEKQRYMVRRIVIDNKGRTKAQPCGHRVDVIL